MHASTGLAGLELTVGVECKVEQDAVAARLAAQVPPPTAADPRDHRQTLEGSFSAVSTATIARVGAFCQIFRDLQDFHPFAPL